MSGKGQRFLLLARRQVSSQTCAAVQLKGAALGVLCALATRSAAPAPSVPGAGRGRGGCPLGGELPGQHLSGGQAPRAASGNSSSRNRKDPPPSSAAAPLHRLCFLLLLLPWPRFSPERAAAASSQRQPRRWRLAAPRSRSPCGPPASAAHSSRHRDSGPAPGEGPAGKLQPGRNRPRRGSRTSAGPRARRGAGVLRRHPPGPHLRRRGVSQSPERTRPQLGAKKVSPENAGAWELSGRLLQRSPRPGRPPPAPAGLALRVVWYRAAPKRWGCAGRPALRKAGGFPLAPGSRGLNWTAIDSRRWRSGSGRHNLPGRPLLLSI